MIESAWDGKRAFKGDRLIQVQYRIGSWSKQTCPASGFRGKWGHPFPTDYEFDVVRVRYVEDANG